MKGVIRYYVNDTTRDTEETDFYFKPEDVRSFFRKNEMIELFLFGQGVVNVMYDKELYKKLVDRM